MATSGRRKPSAPSSTNPVDIAMETAAKERPGDSPAQRVLIGQEKLIEADLKHRGWQIANDRVAVLKGLGVVAALALAIGVGVMVWSASQAKGAVVEAFSVPPDFAARGLTGEVLAAQIQDQLAILQRDTTSQRAGDTYSNDWGRDISVEIPQTGVSIGELQRYLRRWLGKETRITGDVFRTKDGLQLILRANGQAADAVAGTEDELAALVRKGALSLYKKTQPYRWVTYINDGLLEGEVLAVVQALAASGTANERAWGHNHLRINAPTLMEDNRILREGIKLDPNVGLLWANLANNETRLGHPETALQASQRAIEAGGRRDGGGLRKDAALNQKRRLQASQAEVAGDYSAAAAFLDEVFASGDQVQPSNNLRRWRARLLSRLHRISEARAAMAANPDDLGIVKAGFERGIVDASTDNINIARAAEDWAEVYRQGAATDAFITANFKGPNLTRSGELRPISRWTPMAEALAHLGRIDEARALAAQTPLDCYPCVIVRGQVEALAGNNAAADHWFGQALRIGPSAVQAPTDWARALLARGEPDAAIEKLKIAAKIGPRFADAQVLWGEALLAKGDFKGAVEKFREAEPFAPKWGRLHLVWGEALAKAGKRDEAREHWRMAGTLDLTPAERARLAANTAGSR